MALSSDRRAIRLPTMPLARISGWSGVGVSSRTVSGFCRESRQPKAMQHVDDALGHRQRQRGPVALVRQRGELPGPPRPAQVQASGAAAAGLRGRGSQLLAAELLADRGEQRIDDLLGRQPPPRRAGEQRVSAVDLGVVAGCAPPLVGVRVQDQPGDVLQVVVVRDQLAGQPVEQLGVRRLGVVPVVHRLDQAAADVALPQAVDDHLGEALVAPAT